MHISNHAPNTYPNEQERTPQAQTHLQQTNQHPYIIKKHKHQHKQYAAPAQQTTTPQTKQTPCMHFPQPHTSPGANTSKQSSTYYLTNLLRLPEVDHHALI
ncbi:hypothetical protein BO83DRAFT_241499 [Aspergillus eucalypticola CBS 122712]|uniref:Uncharacterized protein n=1 Tax=Aspergillus eucalypticola (strain CBS 122712 / IBT 29274) TaxID=1448314 RepID=A0A317VV64_ASPEC|nr:uncharacterized protein BO83DRAFT_241499 [Aspergillus eucalypticola CBS 122712]PWY76852.1 hypothetical protein BO83DRAFT_241499 [Aspergillus eucalypticola CBS 122712]